MMTVTASDSYFEYPYDDDTHVRSISAELLEGAVQIHIRCEPRAEAESLRAWRETFERRPAIRLWRRIQRMLN